MENTKLYANMYTYQQSRVTCHVQYPCNRLSSSFGVTNMDLNEAVALALERQKSEDGVPSKLNKEDTLHMVHGKSDQLCDYDSLHILSCAQCFTKDKTKIDETFPLPCFTKCSSQSLAIYSKIVYPNYGWFYRMLPIFDYNQQVVAVRW